MATDKVPNTVLEDVYNRFFNVVSHRRSRRVGMGGQIAGPLAYKSSEKPFPLSTAELALLCFAAAGQSGFTPFELPVYAATTLRGRTYPSPCNTQRTQLIFTNDDGIFLYKPRLSKKAVAVQNIDDLQEIIADFDKDIVKLKDGRINLPLGSGGMSLGNEGHCNVPGQTIFMPIVDPSDEMINAVLLSIGGYGQLFVEDDGKPAGVEKWIDKLNLKRKVPLSFFEPYISNWCTLEAGFILQNLLLAAEVMGLGAFPFGGFASPVVMGGTPVTRGLGFRFITDKKGKMNPVGIDGVIEGYCPPYWHDMASAVEAAAKKRYQEGGAYYGEGDSPFLDQKSYAGKMTRISDDVISCAKDFATYIYQTYGRFPSRVDTMVLPLMTVVQHVDLAFYEKFCKPELLSETHRNHMKQWHSK